MRISDWSSDVCSSDLEAREFARVGCDLPDVGAIIVEADARAQASGTADVERIGAHDIDAARARVDGVGEEAHRLVTREAVCDQDVPDPRARQQAGEGEDRKSVV